MTFIGSNMVLVVKYSYREIISASQNCKYYSVTSFIRYSIAIITCYYSDTGGNYLLSAG